MRNVIKTAMLPHFNIYVGVYVKKGSWVATKHTTVKKFFERPANKISEITELHLSVCSITGNFISQNRKFISYISREKYFTLTQESLQ